MFKMSSYYYKGYDIESKSRLEKIKMEYSNPYGYNIESNQRRFFDSEMNATYTNQDMDKSKEYQSK
jgi:hypothetical protein